MKTGTKPGITIALHDTFAPDDPPALFEIAREVGYESVEPPMPRGPAAGQSAVRDFLPSVVSKHFATI